MRHMKGKTNKWLTTSDAICEVMTGVTSAAPAARGRRR